MCVPAERSFTDAGLYLLIDREDRGTEVESLKPLGEIWVDGILLGNTTGQRLGKLFAGQFEDHTDPVQNFCLI